MPEPTTPQHWARAIKYALSCFRFAPGAQDFLKSVMGQASRNRISTKQMYFVKKRVCEKLPHFFDKLDVSAHDHIDPMLVEDEVKVVPIDRGPPREGRVPKRAPVPRKTVTPYYDKDLATEKKNRGKTQIPEEVVIFENPMDQVVEE